MLWVPKRSEHSVQKEPPWYGLGQMPGSGVGRKLGALLLRAGSNQLSLSSCFFTFGHAGKE